MFIRSLKKESNIALMLLLTLVLSMFVAISSAQESNICRDGDAPVIGFGETLLGSLDPNIPVSPFCFDAERGTEVTVTITPITTNLATGLIIGTPFVDNIGLLVDEPLLITESPANGGEYSGTVSIPSDGTYMIYVEGVQNVQGAFNITLEQSEGNVLLAAPTAVPTEEDTSSNSSESPSFADIVYGETDLCTVDVTTIIAYGDTVEGFASAIEPALYCFEASANDIVTISLDILDEESPMGYLVVDPLYDGTPNSPAYSQGFAQVPGEPFTGEFFIERDGRYVLFVVALLEDAIGSYTLSISGAAANIYSCNNEPLATLTSSEWGVLAEDGTELIEMNIACSERLAVSTFGAGEVTQYSVTQSGEFVFIYHNRLYTTTSLSQDEWLIQRDDGQEYRLQALSEPDACSDEALKTLIHGSWLWEIDENQRLFFDFTCNNTVLIDDQQNPSIIGDYSYSENTITMTLGEQVIVFNNVEVNEGIIMTDLDGIAIELQDMFYQGEDAE